MPITTIDPKTALIVIDMQKGILSGPKAHPVAAVTSNIVRIIKAFRMLHLPIVLVNVVGGAPGRNEQGPRSSELPDGWADLIPELDQQESDHLVSKRQWGAFTSTDLHEYLKKMDVTRIFPRLGETGTTEEILELLQETGK
jgi:nicotinamidase-related amidase